MPDTRLTELVSRAADAGLGDQATNLLDTLLAAQAVEKKADTSGAEYKSDTIAAEPETITVPNDDNLLTDREIARIVAAVKESMTADATTVAEQAATKALTAFKADTDVVIKAATDEQGVKLKAVETTTNSNAATIEQLKAKIAELEGEQTAQVKGYRPSQDTEQVKEKADVIATGPVDPVAAWASQRAQGS